MENEWSGLALFILCRTVSVCVMMLPWILSVRAELTANLTNMIIETDSQVNRVNSTITLNCTVEWTSYDEPLRYNASDVQWMHNNEVIPVAKVQASDEVMSQLILERAQIDDRGSYSCCLKQTGDAAHCTSIDLVIGYPPERASNLMCSSNNFRNVNCTWTRGRQDANLTSTDVLLRIRSRSDKSNWERCRGSTSPTCSQTTCNITCSDSSLCYKYRVETTNQLQMVSSSAIFFDTDTNTIPNPPPDVRARNRSSSSLIVEWGLPIGIDDETYYPLLYCVQYTSTDSENVTKEVKGIKENSCIVGNLSRPYGLYYIRVGSYAKHTQPYTCRYSEAVWARTTEAAPADGLENFTCREEDSLDGTRKMFLSWKPLRLENRNGIILDYHISLQNQTSQRNASTFTVTANQTSYVIEGLALNESYFISIEARNSMGLSVARTCDAPIITSSGVPVYMVVIMFIGLIPLMYCCLFAVRWYMKRPDTFSSFQLPSHITNNNLSHVPHRTRVPEREEFDELTESSRPVDQLGNLGNVTAVADEGISNGLVFNDEREPLDDERAPLNVETGSASHDRETVPGGVLNTSYVSSPGPHQPSSRQRICSSGTFSVSSSLPSPISVGSGGSYLELMDANRIAYCRMTREGLSPVDKDNASGQNHPGAGSKAVSPLGGSVRQTDLPLHFAFVDVNKLSSPTRSQEVDRDAVGIMPWIGLLPNPAEFEEDQEARNEGTMEEEEEDPFKLSFFSSLPLLTGTAGARGDEEPTPVSQTTEITPPCKTDHIGGQGPRSSAGLNLSSPSISMIIGEGQPATAFQSQTSRNRNPEGFCVDAVADTDCQSLCHAGPSLGSEGHIWDGDAAQSPNLAATSQSEDGGMSAVPDGVNRGYHEEIPNPAERTDRHDSDNSSSSTGDGDEEAHLTYTSVVPDSDVKEGEEERTSHIQNDVTPSKTDGASQLPNVVLLGIPP